MGQNHREESVVGFSFLLLLGCILIGTGFTQPPPQSIHIDYDSFDRHYAFTLSNESPVFTLSFESTVRSVEIVGFTTNSTAVALLAFADFLVFLNCSNVTSISQLSTWIITDTSLWYGSNIRLVVERTEEDASVSVDLLEQHVIVVAADYIYLVYVAPSVMAVIGGILAVYSLRRLASIGRKHRKERQEYSQTHAVRGRVTPALAALLIVLGGLLIVPFVRGMLLNEYAIVTAVEDVSEGEATFTLNESFPSDGLDLANLCPNTKTNYTIQLQITVTAGFPVIISINGVQGHEEFTLENCTDSDGWLLKFEARADEPKQIWFGKPIDTANIDCRYIVRESVTGRRLNPIPALLMVGVGGILFLSGLIGARRLDHALRADQSHETTH